MDISVNSAKKHDTCENCRLNHPTVLHATVKMDKSVSTDTHELNSTVHSSFTTVKPLKDQTGAGESVKFSVLLVNVKSLKSNKVIQTYALLDNGSSSSFCTESLMQKLDLKGKKTKISLQTMSAKETLSTYLIHDVSVSNVNDAVFFEIPVVYTKKTIPISKDNVSKEDIDQRSYLNHVDIPEVESNVELLIGLNAPNLHEPLKVVSGQNGGPFAMKTRLGWVINGMFKPHGFVVNPCQRNLLKKQSMQIVQIVNKDAKRGQK